MKRGKPLERRTALKRAGGLARTELGQDAEKVREFLKRSRTQLARSKAARPAEGPVSPLEWQRTVFMASGGRCVITGTRARDADDRRFEAHHPFPKRVLRARGLYGRVWDPRNGVFVTRRVHERHEGAFERIPAEALPRSVWEFCAELDLLEGTSWATALVLTYHPSRGSRD